MTRLDEALKYLRKNGYISNEPDTVSEDTSSNSKEQNTETEGK